MRAAGAGRVRRSAKDFPFMEEKHRISGKVFVIMARPAVVTENSWPVRPAMAVAVRLS
jgi:hypothetical protein